MFQADPAKRLADVKENVLSIGHSPAVHLKAHGFGSLTTWICDLIINLIFCIKRQFDTKKSND